MLLHALHALTAIWCSCVPCGYSGTAQIDEDNDCKDVRHAAAPSPLLQPQALQNRWQAGLVAHACSWAGCSARWRVLL